MFDDNESIAACLRARGTPDLALENLLAQPAPAGHPIFVSASENSAAFFDSSGAYIGSAVGTTSYDDWIGNQARGTGTYVESKGAFGDIWNSGIGGKIAIITLAVIGGAAVGGVGAADAGAVADTGAAAGGAGGAGAAATGVPDIAVPATTVAAPVSTAPTLTLGDISTGLQQVSTVVGSAGAIRRAINPPKPPQPNQPPSVIPPSVPLPFSPSVPSFNQTAPNESEATPLALLALWFFMR